MRISKCIIVGDKFVRGVGCLDWTCGYCCEQVSKERYDYMIDKIFEGVE